MFNIPWYDQHDLSVLCLLYFENSLISGEHLPHLFDLVYFTTRATWVRHERHKCNTSEIRATRVRHKCDTNDTSATRVLRERHEWEILILIMTRVETPILAIWQMKDYKKWNNFILTTTFWKCFVPMPKCIWKVHHKNWTL